MERPTIERVWPWILRAVWAALPICLGPLAGEGLRAASRPVQLVTASLAWTVWGLGLVATLVLHPIGLVGMRVAGPAAAALALALSFRDQSSGPASAVGIGAALVVATVILASETGHHCVNGPAYPDERRFLLRPPAVMLVGAIPIAGALLAAGIASGPLLLAARSWIAGGAVLVVGAATAYVCSRSLYGFTRRFFVFVPAGIVLHDPAVLREPVLFRRQITASIDAAEAESDALDLGATASGLAIEVRLREKTEITRISRRNDPGDTRSTALFLFVPTLPGRLVAEARARGYRPSRPTSEGAAMPPPTTMSPS